MGNTLQGFIDDVITVVSNEVGEGTNTGSLKPNTSKFIPVYHTRGRAIPQTGGVIRFLDEVTVGYLTGMENLELANQKVLPVKEEIIKALYTALYTKTFTDIDTFGNIEYVYGPVQWNGQAMFGLLMTIKDVKIHV